MKSDSLEWLIEAYGDARAKAMRYFSFATQSKVKESENHFIAIEGRYTKLADKIKSRIVRKCGEGKR